MEDESRSPLHRSIVITDTMARMYLFLAQSMDRCVSEAARISYPESEFQSNLASTRATMLEMLSVNQVVKEKIEQECNRVGSVVAAYSVKHTPTAAALDELKVERSVLKHKTMALSDLLAVLRAA